VVERADVQNVFNDMGAHAGEEESAQEGVDADLAGTRNFGQERNDAGAQLAQVAGNS